MGGNIHQSGKSKQRYSLSIDNAERPGSNLTFTDMWLTVHSEGQFSIFTMGTNC